MPTLLGNHGQFANSQQAIFSPTEFFGAGEQGLWLDPSQMSTLYQDSNGVTPCTAAGDPVGLILDQSRGGLGALGSELVTNGGFSTGDLTGWKTDFSTGTGSVSVVSNQAVITRVDGSNIGNLDQSISTVSGAFYRLTFTASGASSTRLVIGSSQGNSNILVVNTITGAYSTFFQATSSTTWIRFNGTANSSSNTVDDVSVKFVPGNHAYQSTSGQRPTLARIPSSGRRNLLTRTEEFDNAVWAKLNATATANATTAPDGTSTAEKIFENSTGNVERVVYPPSPPTVAAAVHTFSIYAKASENSWIYVRCDNGTSSGAWFNLQTGAVGTVEAGISAAITNAGNGWYRCSVTKTLSAGAGYGAFQLASADNVKSYIGVVNNGIFAWGAQLETGSSATNYQKVVATTDVTESGVGDLWHLVFDGSDDSLVTNSVDFSGTDEMTVIAGVRKVSDAARGTVCELTATSASNNGAFHLTAPNAASATYAFESKGTTLTDAVASSVTAPLTSVISASSDISGDSNVIRVNGSQSDSDTGDQGTGNYSNAILYIGRRGGTTLPFNGHLYQLIIRGKTTPTGKLLEAERFAAKKTGVSF